MMELDFRGLSCPEPVVRLKQAIENNKSETFKILVSEAHTVKNISYFVNSIGKKMHTKESELDYEIVIE